MRAHALQHVSFEGLGSIDPWLRAAGYEVTRTLLHETAAFPPPTAVDFLVVMGGPMSVNDQALHPWLLPEKEFIRQVMERGAPVLGVCLGAQLIANAMGAPVYPHTEKEIGWFPVQGLPAVHPSLFRFPASVEVFHWHGETFDLPAGATLLARSEACEHQAFQLGRSVIGLQFHLETTPASARDMIRHCRAELRPSRCVQSEAALLAAGPEKYRIINDLMSEVLTFLRGEWR